MGGQDSGSSKGGHPEGGTGWNNNIEDALAAWHCDSGKTLSLMFSHTHVGSPWNP